MTSKQMISRLSTLPDAVVKAWDPDTEQYEEVTGFLYLPNTDGKTIIELQTDEP